MELGTALKRLRRAEFIGDGLGVYVGPHELGIAVLSKGLFRVAVREALAVPLPSREHPAERRHALTDAVLGVVRTRKLSAAPAVLALPRSQALFNRLVLPAAAADNLRDVVEYEMERIIPLPKSELYYDFSMRPFGADRIEVLVMCVPQAAVLEHLDALEDAFVRPRGVVVSSVAVADFFCFCCEEAPGPVGFLLGANGDVEFTIVADRRIITSVLVPRRRAEAEVDLARLVAREFTDELIGTDEVALYTTGANGSGPSTALLGAEELLPIARDRLEAPPELFASQEPAVVPAVGAALAAVRENTVAVNFLPAEGRRGAEGGRWLLTAVLSLMLIFALLAWGVGTVVRDAMLRSELEAELRRLRPQVTQVKDIEKEAADLRHEVEIIAQGRNRHVADFLYEVTKLLPDDAYLTTFRLRGSQIQLDGFARAASELIPKLEGSERFKNVKFGSPTTKARGKDRFSITMEIE
jgi:Tfp pilus assembly protein PilN